MPTNITPSTISINTINSSTHPYYCDISPFETSFLDLSFLPLQLTKKTRQSLGNNTRMRTSTQSVLNIGHTRCTAWNGFMAPGSIQSLSALFQSHGGFTFEPSLLEPFCLPACNHGSSNSTVYEQTDALRPV